MTRLCIVLFLFSVPMAVFSEINMFKSKIPRSTFTDWPFCELGGTYTLPHKQHCDRFFFCQNGQAFLGQCDDGTAFVPFSGCKLLHLVNCTGRPKLQKPQGKGICIRLNGLYRDPQGCGKFFVCANGTAVTDTCKNGLEFDDNTKTCRLATKEELEKCPGPESPLFKCPEVNLFPFGDHSRHPYPGNCFLFIMCLRDGSIKVGSCNKGTAYSIITQNCELLSSVPNCSTRDYPFSDNR